MKKSEKKTVQQWDIHHCELWVDLNSVTYGLISSLPELAFVLYTFISVSFNITSDWKHVHMEKWRRCSHFPSALHLSFSLGSALSFSLSFAPKLNLKLNCKLNFKLNCNVNLKEVQRQLYIHSIMSLK